MRMVCVRDPTPGHSTPGLGSRFGSYGLVVTPWLPGDDVHQPAGDLHHADGLVAVEVCLDALRGERQPLDLLGARARRHLEPIAELAVRPAPAAR